MSDDDEFAEEILEDIQEPPHESLTDLSDESPLLSLGRETFFLDDQLQHPVVLGGLLSDDDRGSLVGEHPLAPRSGSYGSSKEPQGSDSDGSREEPQMGKEKEKELWKPEEEEEGGCPLLHVGSPPKSLVPSLKSSQVTSPPTTLASPSPVFSDLSEGISLGSQNNQSDPHNDRSLSELSISVPKLAVVSVGSHQRVSNLVRGFSQTDLGVNFQSPIISGSCNDALGSSQWQSLPPSLHRNPLPKGSSSSPSFTSLASLRSRGDPQPLEDKLFLSKSRGNVANLVSQFSVDLDESLLGREESVGRRRLRHSLGDTSTGESNICQFVASAVTSADAAVTCPGDDDVLSTETTPVVGLCLGAFSGDATSCKESSFSKEMIFQETDFGQKKSKSEAELSFLDNNQYCASKNGIATSAPTQSPTIVCNNDLDILCSIAFPDSSPPVEKGLCRLESSDADEEVAAESQNEKDEDEFGRESFSLEKQRSKLQLSGGGDPDDIIACGSAASNTVGQESCEEVGLDQISIGNSGRRERMITTLFSEGRSLDSPIEGNNTSEELLEIDISESDQDIFYEDLSDASEIILGFISKSPISAITERTEESGQENDSNNKQQSNSEEEEEKEGEKSLHKSQCISQSETGRNCPLISLTGKVEDAKMTHGSGVITGYFASPLASIGNDAASSQFTGTSSMQEGSSMQLQQSLAIANENIHPPSSQSGQLNPARIKSIPKAKNAAASKSICNSRSVLKRERSSTPPPGLTAASQRPVKAALHRVTSKSLHNLASGAGMKSRAHILQNRSFSLSTDHLERQSPRAKSLSPGPGYEQRVPRHGTDARCHGNLTRRCVSAVALNRTDSQASMKRNQSVSLSRLNRSRSSSMTSVCSSWRKFDYSHVPSKVKQYIRDMKEKDLRNSTRSLPTTPARKRKQQLLFKENQELQTAVVEDLLLPNLSYLEEKEVPEAVLRLRNQILKERGSVTHEGTEEEEEHRQLKVLDQLLQLWSMERKLRYASDTTLSVLQDHYNDLNALYAEKQNEVDRLRFFKDVHIYKEYKFPGRPNGGGDKRRVGGGRHSSCHTTPPNTPYRSFQQHHLHIQTSPNTPTRRLSLHTTPPNTPNIRSLSPSLTSNVNKVTSAADPVAYEANELSSTYAEGPHGAATRDHSVDEGASGDVTLEVWIKDANVVLKRVKEFALLEGSSALQQRERTLIWNSILGQYWNLSSQFPLLSLLHPGSHDQSGVLVQSLGQAISGTASRFRLDLVPSSEFSSSYAEQTGIEAVDDDGIGGSSERSNNNNNNSAVARQELSAAVDDGRTPGPAKVKDDIASGASSDCMSAKRLVSRSVDEAKREVECQKEMSGGGGGAVGSPPNPLVPLRSAVRDKAKRVKGQGGMGGGVIKSPPSFPPSLPVMDRTTQKTGDSAHQCMLSTTPSKVRKDIGTASPNGPDGAAVRRDVAASPEQPTPLAEDIPSIQPSDETVETVGLGDVASTVMSPAPSQASMKTVGPLEKVTMWQESLIGSLVPLGSYQSSSSMSPAASLLSLGSSQPYDAPNGLETCFSDDEAAIGAAALGCSLGGGGALASSDHHLVLAEDEEGVGIVEADVHCSTDSLHKCDLPISGWKSSDAVTPPRLPLGRTAVKARDLDSGCPGSERSTRISQNASLEILEQFDNASCDLHPKVGNALLVADDKCSLAGHRQEGGFTSPHFLKVGGDLSPLKKCGGEPTPVEAKKRSLKITLADGDDDDEENFNLILRGGNANGRTLDSQSPKCPKVSENTLQVEIPKRDRKEEENEVASSKGKLVSGQDLRRYSSAEKSSKEKNEKVSSSSGTKRSKGPGESNCDSQCRQISPSATGKRSRCIAESACDFYRGEVVSGKSVFSSRQGKSKQPSLHRYDTRYTSTSLSSSPSERSSSVASSRSNSSAEIHNNISRLKRDLNILKSQMMNLTTEVQRTNERPQQSEDKRECRKKIPKPIRAKIEMPSSISQECQYSSSPPLPVSLSASSASQRTQSPARGFEKSDGTNTMQWPLRVDIPAANNPSAGRHGFTQKSGKVLEPKEEEKSTICNAKRKKKIKMNENDPKNGRWSPDTGEGRRKHHRQCWDGMENIDTIALSGRRHRSPLAEKGNKHSVMQTEGVDNVFQLQQGGEFRNSRGFGLQPASPPPLCSKDATKLRERRGRSASPLIYIQNYNCGSEVFIQKEPVDAAVSPCASSDKKKKKKKQQQQNTVKLSAAKMCSSNKCGSRNGSSHNLMASLDQATTLAERLRLRSESMLTHLNINISSSANYQFVGQS